MLRLLYTFDIFPPQTKLHTEPLATLTIQRSLRPYSLYLFHIPIPDIPADRSLADHRPAEAHEPSQILSCIQPKKRFKLTEPDDHKADPQMRG